MKKVSRVLRDLKDHKPKISLYFTFSLLAVLFSLVSLMMLGPILQVIFSSADELTISTGDTNITEIVSGAVNNIIRNDGKQTALLYVCIAAVVFTLFKNLFLYLSLYILNPLRNSILRRLRDDLFTKTLSLPIGFFS